MKKTVFVLAAAALLAGCQPSFVILHVNDTHSHLEPDHGGDRCGMGGIVERAAIVDSVRRSMGPRRTLLLHAGDFNQGTSYFSELGGRVEVDLVNALGYDCIALGNHEFDNGIEDLEARLRRMECPVVCANLDLSPFALGEIVKPYTIVRKAGRKIGIIGLTSNLRSNVAATISSRIPQLDNVEETNRWAEFLKDEKKCDFIILLSHLGYREDLELIPQVRNIDIVVGGHSHTFIEDMEYATDMDGKAVPVVQDGCFGYYVGEVRVR